MELILPENPEPMDASRMISIHDNTMFITAGGRKRAEKRYESLGKRLDFLGFKLLVSLSQFWK